jgi:hypothetical protein
MPDLLADFCVFLYQRNGTLLKPPSVNVWGNKLHSRRIYTSYRSLCIKNIARAPSKREGPVVLCITRQMAKGDRAYDHDNLVGGCKPLVDALKQRGWIDDDRPNRLDAHHHQDRGAILPHYRVAIFAPEAGNACAQRRDHEGCDSRDRT